MKTRVLVTILIALVLGGGKAYAQDDYFFGFAYTPLLPLGNTKDFAGDFSWRGATMEGRRVVKPNMTLGFSLGWQVLNSETDSVVSFGLENANAGVDVQGFQIRTINSFPLLATLHYYLGQRGGFRPYAGGGVGISYLESRVNLGGVIIEDSGWPITLAAELGGAFPMGWRSAGFLFARLYWQAASSAMQSQTYIAFGAGVAWQ